MVYILQWNARSLIANGQEMKKCIRDLDPKPDFICVQETWLKPNLDFIVPGFECLRKDRPDRSGGGCATFIRTGIQYKPVKWEGALECVITQVWCHEGKFNLINCYNPCKPLVQAEFEDILDRVGTPIIWVGDYNAHNPLWGSIEKDSNGTIIEEFLDLANLVVLNTGAPTRIDPNSCKGSCLDLTFVTPSLARLGEWRVESDSWGSDHFPVSSHFGRSLVEETRERDRRFNFSLVDWGKFNENVSAGIEDVNSSGSIDEYCDSLTAIIMRAASNSIPLRKFPKQRSIVPWWNSECDAAVKKRKVAFRRVREFPTQENVIEYKKCRAAARKIIKAERRTSWRNFCGTLGPDTPSVQLWKRIRRMAGKGVTSTIPVLTDGQKEAVNNKEKADMCAKVFKDVHNSKHLGQEILRLRREVLIENKSKLDGGIDTNNQYNLFFSLKEVEEAIQAGANTTPGQDGISYKLLQHVGDDTLYEILALYNYVWESGTLPKSWKHAIVAPILKPGKDPSSPSAYRPIALTSVLCKVMERMVTKRLEYYLETSGFFVNH